MFASPPARERSREDAFGSELSLADLQNGKEMTRAAVFSPCRPAGADTPDSWKLAAHGGAGSPGRAISTGSPGKVSEYLASVRRVDDLRKRLELLEQTLRAMEFDAVRQLDKQLQEKVLATALKLVQQRSLVEGALEPAQAAELLATAVKVVEARREEAQAPGEEEGRGQEQLARRLEFAQGADAGAGAAESLLEQFAARIEAGLGESLRRVERKAELVAGLLDQGAIDLIEQQLAAGLSMLERRVDALEAAGAERCVGAAAGAESQGAGERGGGASAEAALGPRMAALEAAVRDQQRAVLEVVALLRQSAGAQPTTSSAAPAREPAPRSAPQPAPPARSPGRPAGAGAASPAARRAARPKLKQLHSAGAAQRIALQTARSQMARAAAAQEQRKLEAEEGPPLLLQALHVVMVMVICVLGAAALAAGCVAVATQKGLVDPAAWGLPL